MPRKKHNNSHIIIPCPDTQNPFQEKKQNKQQSSLLKSSKAANILALVGSPFLRFETVGHEVYPSSIFNIVCVIDYAA
jgi:hypothetical protein